MENNAPTQKANIAQEYMQRVAIRCMNWIVRSLNYNSIKHLWKKLKTHSSVRSLQQHLQSRRAITNLISKGAKLLLMAMDHILDSELAFS